MPSYRRFDLMRVCHMTRAQVAAALEELMLERLVVPFSGRTRYAVRTRICPDAATPAHTNQLVDDTHQLERRPCAIGLGALAHTGGAP